MDKELDNFCLEVEKLSPQPGDLLVIYINTDLLDRETIKDIYTYIVDQYPEYKFLFLPKDKMELKYISQERKEEVLEWIRNG